MTLGLPARVAATQFAYLPPCQPTFPAEPAAVSSGCEALFVLGVHEGGADCLAEEASKRRLPRVAVKGCFDHHEVRLPDVLGQAVGRFRRRRASCALRAVPALPRNRSSCRRSERPVALQPDPCAPDRPARREPRDGRAEDAGALGSRTKTRSFRCRDDAHGNRRR
jgi:hypothetical protein